MDPRALFEPPFVQWLLPHLGRGARARPLMIFRRSTHKTPTLVRGAAQTLSSAPVLLQPSLRWLHISTLHSRSGKRHRESRGGMFCIGHHFRARLEFILLLPAFRSLLVRNAEPDSPERCCASTDRDFGEARSVVASFGRGGTSKSRFELTAHGRVRPARRNTPSPSVPQAYRTRIRGDPGKFPLIIARAVECPPSASLYAGAPPPYAA